MQRVVVLDDLELDEPIEIDLSLKLFEDADVALTSVELCEVPLHQMVERQADVADVQVSEHFVLRGQLVHPFRGELDRVIDLVVLTVTILVADEALVLDVLIHDLAGGSLREHHLLWLID